LVPGVNPARSGNARGGLRLALFLCVAVALSACNLADNKVTSKAELDTAPKVTEAQVGVPASPRVTEARDVPKGGGRYQVGKPYKVRGKVYVPEDNPEYAATGKASWYGANFHGRKTANGELFDQYSFSAAHPTMPLPSYARVTNLDNGSSMIVRVNDRGPFAHNRIIDVSSRAADMLGFKDNGVADVKVEYVGKANLAGSDEKFLMASYRSPGVPEIVPGATQPGTMIAMAEEPQTGAEDALAAEAGSGMLLAFVPLPTPRPAYFPEGTPLDLFSPNLAIVRQPTLNLGFAAESGDHRRIADAFAAVDGEERIELASPSEVDPEKAAEVAVVELGVFHDRATAEYVRTIFSDIGLVSISEAHLDGGNGWQLTMLSGADVADSIIAAAQSRGMAAWRAR
jgi:rare lipoprotein A